MRLAQLAINSVSTRQSSLEEALSAYSAAGFQNVEFVLPELKNWIAAGRSTADAAKLLAGFNLRSVGGFEAGLEAFSSPESMKANHDLHLANARLIHELGGGALIVGTDGPETPSVEALARVGEVFRDLAERMDGLDVDLAVEFNWSPLVKSLKSALAVVEKADHPRVGILFDTAHFHCTSSKLEHLDARTVRWIKHVHVNDMQDKPGELSNCNSDRVLPGKGILDIKEILGRIDDHGYRGYISIEMFNDELWAMSASEAARCCYQSLLPLVG